MTIIKEIQVDDTLVVNSDTISVQAVTVTDTNVQAAADLITIDNNSDNNVDATGVTTITGTATDIQTVLLATTIDISADVEVVVSSTIKPVPSH